MAGEKIAEAYVLLGADLNPLLDALKKVESETRDRLKDAGRHGVDFGNVMANVARSVGGLGASLYEAGTSIGPLVAGMGAVGRMIVPVAGGAGLLAGAATTAAIQFGNTERNLLTSAMILSGYHMTLGDVLSLSERMAVATNRSRDEIVAMLPPILQAGVGAQDLAEFFQLAHAAAFNTSKSIQEMAPVLARILSQVGPSGAPAELGLPTIPPIGGPMMDVQVQEAVRNALRTIVPVAQQFDRETMQGAARGLWSGVKELASGAGELAEETGAGVLLREAGGFLREAAGGLRKLTGRSENKLQDIVDKAIAARAASQGTTVDALLELGPRDPMLLGKTSEQSESILRYRRQVEIEKQQRDILGGRWFFWEALNDKFEGGQRTMFTPQSGYAESKFDYVYDRFINAPRESDKDAAKSMIDPDQVNQLIQAIQMMNPMDPRNQQSRAVPDKFYEGLVY